MPEAAAMKPLPAILTEPERRPKVLDDCIEVLDAEVDSKSGKYLTSSAKAFLELCRSYELDYPQPEYQGL